jgi:hypothetical protein
MRWNHLLITAVANRRILQSFVRSQGRTRLPGIICNLSSIRQRFEISLAENVFRQSTQLVVMNRSKQKMNTICLEIFKRHYKEFKEVNSLNHAGSS